MSGRLAELESRLLAGDRRALARVLSWVESGDERGREMLRALYPRSGRARTIGLTGSPGAGKSTVTNELAKSFRARGQTVGIVAIDPSSPYTMGAILGDRVRMTELYSDEGVFIRSLASRGALGGLSAATQDVVHILDAYGKDVILIETVGAGQDEVDIAGAAQTTILVNTPNMGDEVQTLKAGIMEIADVLAVNKSDLPGADRMVSALKALLSLNPDRGWDPPVVRIVGTKGEGIDKLTEACDSHFEELQSSGKLEAAELARARQQITSLARANVLNRMRTETGEQRLVDLSKAVARRRADPHSAAAAWLADS
ncbi:MAG: methylmalonyl Co-A mutase-associated GTPase MeaB [Chloroflexi bacterium]|nr:methylmalonyl Co-A mutase-associated GTPase MeaB [Chloroflexota bacterium]MYF23020.1 methylmalonyl Co-A mutase-associated GTPase MeaB [Chloroflexota bacterium]